MHEKLSRLMPALLELSDVTARYGQVVALHGVSLTVDDGEIVALLGANGAGKTTTLRAVSGTVRRTATSCSAASGSAVRRRRRWRATGVAHVPEGRGIFAELTVWENLRMGGYTRASARLRVGAGLLPLARGAAQPAGGDAVGRRAADARAGARVPRAAAPADARRAVARPRAAHHARGLPRRRPS